MQYLLSERCQGNHTPRSGGLRRQRKQSPDKGKTSSVFSFFLFFFSPSFSFHCCNRRRFKCSLKNVILTTCSNGKGPAVGRPGGQRAELRVLGGWLPAGCGAALHTQLGPTSHSSPPLLPFSTGVRPEGVKGQGRSFR